jgi:hypothetical protein
LATTAIIEEEETNNNFNRKLELATAGLLPYYNKVLSQVLPIECAADIVDYLIAMKTEKNLSLHSREIIIKTLKLLARFTSFNTWKSTITRDDILAFLDSYRKPEASDPLHKWIGTYNLYKNVLMSFFKWLHEPNVEPQKRPKPSCMQGIPQLRRKEKSTYEPSESEE